MKIGDMSDDTVRRLIHDMYRESEVRMERELRDWLRSESTPFKDFVNWNGTTTRVYRPMWYKQPIQWLKLKWLRDRDRAEVR